MKKLSLFTCAGLLFGLAACDSTSVQMLDDAPLGQTIVITEGIPAPPHIPLAPPQRSDLAVGSNLGGSEADAISLKPNTCESGFSQEFKITYTITGRQDNPASFKVYTSWSYDGTTWNGNDALTVDSPPRGFGSDAPPPTLREVDVEVTNDSSADDAQSSFTIVPFDVVTSGPGALNVSQGDVAIHVNFVSCPTTNTPPTLILPTPDIVPIEATSAAGTFVDPLDHVSATDLEDDNETLEIQCSPIAGTFSLGDHSIECSVTDSGGLSDSGSFVLRVQDTTPPVFLTFPENPVQRVANDINGWLIDLSNPEENFGITASDVPLATPVSNPVDIMCTPDTPNGTATIGSMVGVTCRATDQAGNWAEDQFDIFVTLDLSTACGFTAPLRNEAPYSAHRRNSAIPHKLCAPRYANGHVAGDLIHTDGIRLVVTLLNTEGEATSTTYDDPAPGSSSWKYDADEERYHFNAKTSNQWSEGTWKTTVSYAGITLAETKFVLRR